MIVFEKMAGVNRTMREELREAWQYWCFRAKYSKKRTWYFWALAWVCRKLEDRAWAWCEE